MVSDDADNAKSSAESQAAVQSQKSKSMLSMPFKVLVESRNALRQECPSLKDQPSECGK